MKQLLFSILGMFALANPIILWDAIQNEGTVEYVFVIIFFGIPSAVFFFWLYDLLKK